MSAVKEIQPAIDKLTKQKLNAYSGPWRIINETMQGDHGLEHELCDINEVATGAWTEDNGYRPALLMAEAELIVTLHRTIDAQLGVLDFARTLTPLKGKTCTEWASITLALELARAINGTV